MNIAIYTNILTPYRKYFYDALYQECKKCGDNFYVLLMAETEPNRNWEYNDFKTEYTILLQGRTVTVGNIYIHFNKNLEEVLTKLRLDILICAGSYLCPGIWQVLKWKAKLRYTTFYWSESHLNESRNYNGLKVAIREKIRRMVYEKFDGFWYAGKLSLQFIKKYAQNNCLLQFMPNLVEEEKYHRAALISKEENYFLRERYGIEKQKIVFICPARLSAVKGIDKFIPILAKCKNKDKVTILLAGDGELKEEIETEVKNTGLDIRLLGFQSQQSIIELYSLSDIFLLPSLSDPNPLTCIEALWAGLPLFISEHCGNYPEVVKNGKNGFVFNYHDEQKTICKLDKIIDSNAEWRNMAKTISLQIADEKYNSTLVVKSIIKKLHEVRNGK